jgi:uncharacterized protein
MNETHFSNISDQNRFELQIEEYTAFIDYILNKKGVLYLTHTEVPKELEGRGIASRLVKAVFRHAEKNELKIAPICPFVKSYLQRHPEWKRLLSEEHRF